MRRREREKEIFGMEGETRKNLRRNRGRERKGIEKLEENGEERECRTTSLALK